MKRILVLLLSLLLVSSLTACGEKADTQPQGAEQAKKVTVMLDWVPNTNHTGLFVALEKGWYKEQGLDVEIIQPAEGGTAQLVAANKADFGVGPLPLKTMRRRPPSTSFTRARPSAAPGRLAPVFRAIG